MSRCVSVQVLWLLGDDVTSGCQVGNVKEGRRSHRQGVGSSKGLERDRCKGGASGRWG